MKKIKILFFAFSFFSLQSVAQLNGISAKVSSQNPMHVLGDIFYPAIGYDLLYTHHRNGSALIELGFGYYNFAPSKGIYFFHDYAGKATATVGNLTIIPMYLGASWDINIVEKLKMNCGADWGFYFATADAEIHTQNSDESSGYAQPLLGGAPKVSFLITDENKYRIGLEFNYNFYISIDGTDDFARISNSTGVFYTILSTGIKGSFFF